MNALEYLGNLISAHREHVPSFSFRRLADRVGLKSPNYIQHVLAGKKKLSSDLASRICVAIKAPDAQRETLLLLLKRDTSSDPRVRALIDVRLEALFFEENATTLQVHDHVLFQTWFAPVVWAYAAGRQADEVSQQFPALCNHLVNQKEVDRVLGVLLKARLLAEDQRGYLQIRSEVLEGRTGVSPDVLRSFYSACAGATRKMLVNQNVGGKAQGSGPVSLSRVTTFSCSEGSRDTLHERITAFHKELITEFALSGESADRPGAVVQICTFANHFSEAGALSTTTTDATAEH